MKYLLCLAILMGCSYEKKVVNSEYYRIALDELSFHSKKEDLVLISKKELEEHSIFVFAGDTLHFKPRKVSFGFRNMRSGQLTLYQFNENVGIYTRIECDSNWKVLQMTPVAEIY